MGEMRVLITFFYITMLYLTFTPFATSVYFKFSSFGSNNNEILYRGSVVPSSGSVAFTPVKCQVGQAIYADRVQMRDSKSGKVSDFTTRFSFTIDTIDRPSNRYGHGFAFFIGPADFQIPTNSAGSFLGLYNLSNYRESTQNQMIHVEFDSFVDSDWDPEYEHVGINKNSIVSANYTAWNAGNHSGSVADVIITYNSQTTMLMVSWTYNKPIPPNTSSVSYHVDLKEVLTEWVTVGFSSGTGNHKEKNSLLYWEFNSSLNGKWRNPQEGSGSGSGSGSGISGYIVPGVIGVIIGLAIAMMIISMATFMFKKGWIKYRGMVTNEAILEKIKLIRDTESEVRHAPLRYSYSDLHLATNGFSDDNKLGEGGFGGVYKGRLTVSLVNQEVAVKKISEHSTQGENEYTAEVATIGKLNHPNLVELVGWCDDEGKFLLIYKIMPNGGLDSYLFGNKGPLVWSNRYKIAQGLALALHHLHEEQGEKYVIHRDIKPSNVMLDSEFNPKLGDFGLARLKDNNEQGLKTTKLTGTFGYCAPEYVSSGKASKVTDMYSFGVTLLEIGSGRNMEDQTCNIDLVKWVWHLYGEKQLRSTIDVKLLDVDKKEYDCLMMVGLSCTHPDPSKRLTIEGVIEALEKVIPPEVPIDMPILRYDTPTNHPSTSELSSHAESHHQK